MSARSARSREYPAVRMRREGMSNAEIAAALNVPVAAVVSCLEFHDAWEAKYGSAHRAPELTKTGLPRIHLLPSAPEDPVQRGPGRRPTWPVSTSRFLRDSYLRATARLLFVHGPNCYAPYNIRPG